MAAEGKHVDECMEVNHPINPDNQNVSPVPESNQATDLDPGEIEQVASK